ncbi:F-box/kelch-repeat protein [Prunus yedoensis var. nudiflora]|uniref:F-box/kelch-repeat protein n=1 Tax=Prunus yedoensis var. nudiflora TaxID=2094558 RepID=A0A314UL84_PRUYE|nr:F-box/kelch-repeat protein [Prunus yedoensis var. nudiflora]
MGAVITDVPESVLQDVIIKLPTKSIIMCKSVCKTWYSLISDPAFAKLHFAQAEAYPMVRPVDRRSVSRNLYLVEPEDSSGFDLKDHDCNRCRVHMNLSKYKFPLCHPEELLNYHRNGIVMPTKRTVCIKITQIDENNYNLVNCSNGFAYIMQYDHNNYNLVNSCNGLLCLSYFLGNHPAAVCNPITGEFINLPRGPKHEKAVTLIGSGLGFSPRTNEYKVMRILKERTPDPNKVAEIHTLGTGSWKSVGTAPCSDSELSFPTCVKGMLYWLWHKWPCCSVISFDLDTEEFLSVPSVPFGRVDGGEMSMGDLGGSLCLCKAESFDINVWVMDDSGSQKLWKKKVSIRTAAGISRIWPCGVYIPMKYFENDGLLMFHPGLHAFVYHHPGNHSPFIYLQLRGIKYSSTEAISHVPSFISLKDILVGKDVEILNINSRCALLKLPGETEALSLVEENSWKDYNVF